MRTIELLSGVDASVNQTSSAVDFQQRSEWHLQIVKSGTNGNPNLFIEFSLDNSVWTPVLNPENLLFVFPINDSPYAVRDTVLQGQFFRIRLEPNGTTTGTITANFGFKTYP